jgi:hypothetical protein
VQPLLQWKSNEYYTECVFVALGTQHAMGMRHTVICGLPRSTIFFHIITQPEQFFFEGVGGITEHKMCVLFSLRLLSETLLFVSDFNETNFLDIFFKNTQIYIYIYIFFNSFSGSPAVPCGQT